WMVFNLLMILTFTNLLNTKKRIWNAFKLYVGSFLIIGLFGIFQFFAPIIGLGAPLIRQWWMVDVFPRVNGFSYEPSYFASYMLIGWVISFYLYRYKSTLYTRNVTLLIFIVCSLSMILSSSRMGLVVIGVFFLWQFIKNILSGRMNKWFLRMTITAL